MIDLTPDPVFVRILGFPIYWYGIAYAVGLAAVYWVLIREARHRGLDEDLLATGMIVVAIAALIGGRLYHVIDQWQLYQANPITAILPLSVQADGSYSFSGFTGLGVPGGIVLGTIAAWAYIRRHHQPFWQWADVVAPGLFVMQAIGRWGNFFNQELYGPPTTLPWGIRIDAAHRVGDYVDLTTYPVATTHFHPLFLYESVSGLVGALVLLWLARRRRSPLVSGDLLLIFFIWYGLTRFALEGLRTGNWTFFGIPTAQIVTAGFILVGVIGLVYRHGPGRPAQTAAELLPDRDGGPATVDDEEAFWSDDADEADDPAGGAVGADADADADAERDGDAWTQAEAGDDLDAAVDDLDGAVDDDHDETGPRRDLPDPPG
jgi:phosphatidylglycerol:prolipoprotein diacylglycerol transferase